MDRIDKYALSNRLQSMVFDFAMSMFSIIPLLLVSLLEIVVFKSDLSSRILIPIAFISIILTKDNKGGRSIGKRLRGFRVVDSKTNEPANSIQCVIRNMTFLIWPIEALLLLGTPEYRIGDFFARTKVVEFEKSDPREMLNE